MVVDIGVAQMSSTWINDPIFWILTLPALGVSGVLVQMILSLFSCCGAFRFQGRAVHLKWWMIPAASLACGLLWIFAVAYVVFFVN